MEEASGGATETCIALCFALAVPGLGFGVMDMDRIGARHSVAAYDRDTFGPVDLFSAEGVRDASSRAGRCPGLLLPALVATASLALMAGVAFAEPVPNGQQDAAPSGRAELADAPMPTFLDTQSVRQLEQAMSSAGANGQAATDAADGSRPPIGATAFGAGLSSFLPEMLKPDGSDQRGTGASLTTADFSSTLERARADTGEVRALADEVRQRAEEISQRFSGGTLQPGGAVPAHDPATIATRPVTAALGAKPDAVSVRDAATLASQFASGGVVNQLAKAVASTSGSDAANLLGSPPSALPAEAAAAATAVPAKQDAAEAPLEGRMALGHRHAAPADSAAVGATGGIEIIPSHAPAAAPPPARRAAVPLKRLPGMAAPLQPRPPRRAVAAKAEAAGKASSKVQNRTGPAALAAAKPASAKPPIVRSSTESALAAAARQAHVPPEAPKTGGGLFSSLKPFTLPREIGSHGWDAND